MKINNTPTTEALKAYGAQSLHRVDPYKESSNSTKNQQLLSSDKVNISSTVKLMQDIQKAVEDAPDIRTDKVRDVETKIEKGIYKADLTVVADKLLSPNISDRI
ncbi:MAG TPA: flagellar biosynthesis anti-sigma factor FlgM [Deltaproteobacteria bacterium]|nr:flagellar biosynthesis anti-sigma factor FlgM [Deltaproteobacteria bacterium]HPR55120.1 flagellar biosynthesis anti-sigma factor FlgM [Deltaproteobacteria bacterium]HXK47298.1 flagellar biosynthesis anti-sigma factor FlgM [Deltaproteobacteria bacterium]